jgi:integrase
LFMDFRLNGKRVREYTALPDTPPNRKRLQKALDRIETEIALGSFDYAKTFGKPLPQERAPEADDAPQAAGTGAPVSPAPASPPTPRCFATSPTSGLPKVPCSGAAATASPSAARWTST